MEDTHNTTTTNNNNVETATHQQQKLDSFLVSDNDELEIIVPSSIGKKRKNSTANSSYNLALMSDSDIKASIERSNRLIAEGKLPEKGAKLKNYVHQLEIELQRRKFRPSQQDASGCKRPLPSAAATFIDTNSLIKVCPSGCFSDDQVWEEKGRTLISQIFLSSEKGYICGLQFQYVEDGKLALSQTYGRHVGLNFKSVTFHDVSEYIIGVNGTFGKFKESRAVKSITVKTNRKIYELFGSPEDGDTSFSYRFGPGNKFGGFHGSFSSVEPFMLTSIGVFVNPYLDLDGFLSPSA